MLSLDEIAKILYVKSDSPELFDKWILKGRPPIYSREMDKVVHETTKLYTRMNNKNKLACIAFVPSFTFIVDTIKSKGLFYIIESDNKILYKDSSLEHIVDYFNAWFRGDAQ